MVKAKKIVANTLYLLAIMVLVSTAILHIIYRNAPEKLYILPVRPLLVTVGKPESQIKKGSTIWIKNKSEYETGDQVVVLDDGLFYVYAIDDFAGDRVKLQGLSTTGNVLVLNQAEIAGSVVGIWSLKTTLVIGGILLVFIAALLIPVKAKRQG